MEKIIFIAYKIERVKGPSYEIRDIYEFQAADLHQALMRADGFDRNGETTYAATNLPLLMVKAEKMKVGETVMYVRPKDSETGLSQLNPR
jgi:hypothetical protein